MSHFFGMLICLHLGVNNRYGDHAARALSRDGALLSELRGQHHHCQLARGHPSPLFRRCRPRRRPCSQEHLHSLGQYFEMQPCRRSCSHGDVVQEAWFCLGCRRLGPPLRRSNLEPVILQDPGFIAALSQHFLCLRRAQTAPRMVHGSNAATCSQPPAGASCRVAWPGAVWRPPPSSSRSKGALS